MSVFSLRQKQLDDTIHLNATSVKIGGNTHTRVIGVCEMYSFHGGVGDFSVILRVGEVAYRSAHLGISLIKKNTSTLLVLSSLGSSVIVGLICPKKRSFSS